jgi:hypothetical protein
MAACGDTMRHNMLSRQFMGNHWGANKRRSRRRIHSHIQHAHRARIRAFLIVMNRHVIHRVTIITPTIHIFDAHVACIVHNVDLTRCLHNAVVSAARQPSLLATDRERHANRCRTVLRFRTAFCSVLRSIFFFSVNSTLWFF